MSSPPLLSPPLLSSPPVLLPLADSNTTSRSSVEPSSHPDNITAATAAVHTSLRLMTPPLLGPLYPAGQFGQSRVRFGAPCLHFAAQVCTADRPVCLRQ